MANEKKKPTTKWHGDEVQRSPGVDAERGAERAEGNGEVEMAEAVRPDDAAPAEPGARKTRRGTADDAEAKIAEAAEAHRARRAAGDGPPRKTL